MKRQARDDPSRTMTSQINARDRSAEGDRLLRLERSNAMLRAENLSLKNSLRETRNEVQILEDQRDRLRSALHEGSGNLDAGQFTAMRARCDELERTVHQLAGRRALRIANRLGAIKRSVSRRGSR